MHYQGRNQPCARRFSLGTLFQDIRFAFRQLRKAPNFAAAAVLTLALGIGANTAIFSLVNSLLLKPLPVLDPQQIATLAPRENKGPLQLGLSWNEYKEVRAQSTRSFSDLLAYTMSIDGLAVNGQKPDRIMTTYVSGNFFEGLGLKPAAGRLLLRSEGEVLGQDPVVVLGYQYWQERFNGDPNVVGQIVTLDRHPVTIVGVAPKDFFGMNPFLTMAAYLPLSELPLGGTPADVINNWQNRMFIVNGRLVMSTYLETMRSCIEGVAEHDGRPLAEIERFYLHQPNDRLLRLLSGMVGLREGQVATNVARLGNTSSAGMFILVAQDLDSGRVTLGSGVPVVLAAIGAGVHYGAQLVCL